ncbi:Stk1 family PASTA domain-containing Ser/Thr kinase [Fusibacter tunisiensis]|uniref:non-specific serine/threonine protein kinase n=1 Tax=Fusibacter tunisiensis TaxID=1008308 RepID=A0ABS2MMB7_9FIRM|nr:Stk1 family PASTA domain-containing Ser/Thr kinase [Fusibacter tunisiensis]MBM7560541.1 serine/threonine-protein kinase [Fusibacter tunisiensis]
MTRNGGSTGHILSNRYEILEVLGTGGMATVYKGKDLILNRLVAIKVLKTEYNSDAEFVNKFKKESQAAARMSHPNIVNIFDVGFSDDHHYIVMELVSGNTLKDYLDQMNGYMKEEAIINIVLQVASALSEAHSKEIIHRDIKSQNILVGENGSIKVADFGIARAATTSTLVNTREIIGSVHYASPEQARGGYVDARSDIYSTGIMMFEMATRRLPFEGESPVSIALMQIKDDLPDPRAYNPEISKGLSSIICKASEKSPSLRYQNMSEFIHDLKMLQRDKDFVAELGSAVSQETMVIPKVSDDTINMHKPVVRKKPVMETKLEDERLDEVKGVNKINMTLIILSALIMAILVFGIFAFGRFKAFFEVEEVSVPMVVGLHVDEAVTQITALGLVADATERRFNGDVELDHVISQNHESGDVLKEGNIVKLVISNGAVQGLVPNVKQQDLKEARIIIEGNGFEVGRVDYEFNDFPEGMVIEQSPKSGVRLGEGSVIDLVVSRGPEIKTYIVPSIIGNTIREAEITLNQLGLKLGSISYELSDAYDEGQIMAQEFLGEEVKQGTEIPVVVSNGPETLPIETSPDGTPIEGETTEGETTELNLTIPLNVDKFSDETETIRIEMLNQGVVTVIYENVHSKAEGPEIFIPAKVSGTGTAIISVYYGDVVGYEQEIEF